MSSQMIDPGCPVDWDDPLNRDLAGWWLCLPDQPRGVIWRDIVGLSGRKGNDGTLTTMDPATDWLGPRGRPGGWGCLDFDGSDDTVTFTSVSVAGGTITYSCWFFVRAFTATRNFLIHNRQTGLSVQSGSIEWWPNTATTLISIPFTLATGLWYHLGVTQSGTAYEVFLNGRSIVSGTTAALGNSTEGAQLGRWVSAAWQHDGYLDDVRLQTATVPVPEIYQQSRCGYPDLLNRHHLVAYSVPEAAPGGFNSAWASRNVHVIGAGL